MICPKCQTPNEAEAQFCANCGALLAQSAKLPKVRSPREWLGILTAQLLLGLLLIYIVKAILVAMPFIKELRIPDFDLTPIAIINILVGLVIVALIIKFILDLRTWWPRAFPGYASLADLCIAILVLILLSAIYSAVKPLFILFTADVPELPMIVQILLLLAALFFASRAVILVYQNLPAWLLNLRKSFTSGAVETDFEQ